MAILIVHMNLKMEPVQNAVGTAKRRSILENDEKIVF